MSVRENLGATEDRISAACLLGGRAREAITLIAVTKTVPIERIQEAYDAGHRDFGESRLQEALPKIEALPKDIRWHFIGKLQSNKARKAGEVFDAIHSVESVRQARELAKSGPCDVFIEVNIAKEPQKSGILPADLAEIRKSVLQYELLHLRGLMTIGPANRNAEEMRQFFRELRELNDSIGGQWLSMGMSNDFEVAIQEGSTHVRIGTAIFGTR